MPPVGSVRGRRHILLFIRTNKFLARREWKHFAGESIVRLHHAPYSFGAYQCISRIRETSRISPATPSIALERVILKISSWTASRVSKPPQAVIPGQLKEMKSRIALAYLVALWTIIGTSLCKPTDRSAYRILTHIWTGPDDDDKIFSHQFGVNLLKTKVSVLESGENKYKVWVNNPFNQDVKDIYVYLNGEQETSIHVRSPHEDYDYYLSARKTEADEVATLTSLPSHVRVEWWIPKDQAGELVQRMTRLKSFSGH
ncbi:hypothetical protein Pst134EA_007287 [Puccinia striiformis f. sp. tritici]|nr:hypothetical protein Pst134EA_007287 [Puccinia striiformis f. sp. tritici]KAH9470023.1 hypothetical protein Pst134EA_007287 [Puccinia striiformis f. sp. tritici]